MVTDPKGELYAKHAATFRKNGYTVNVIDLSDVYHSTRWNPFNDVWRKTDEMLYSTVTQKNGKYYSAGIEYLTNAEAENAQRERVVRLRDEIYVDLQDLVYTMCPVENKNDQTWQRGARDLLFALVFAFWEDVRDGYMPREKFNLYNLYRNVTDYAKGDCDELKAYFETRRPESRTRGLSNTVLVSEDRTLSSYLGDVNQYLNWMADGGIAALTSGNEIEFTEFDEKPNALFLKIPDEKENRYKLVSLFVVQMYKALVEKATRNKELSKTKEQTLLRNVYFLMDEFGNLPKMHKMDTIVTVGRSRHIYTVPVIQDFNQLDEKYGKEVAATIRSNCNIQIFIGSNDENTRKIISEACGKKKVKQISYSENRDMSVSTSAQSVPLIYPNELEHLNDPANGIIGNAIVLCLGNYPIRSKITPIFRAQKFYKPEHTEISKGAFIDFDETKTHYDIEQIKIQQGYSYYDFDADTDVQKLISWQDGSPSFWENWEEFGFWDTLFGNIPSETGREISPIQVLKESDLQGTEAEVSQRLLVNVKDVEDLKAAYDDAIKVDPLDPEDEECYLVLFRFATSDYYAAPVDIYQSDFGGTVHKGQAYVARQSVFFDFDVIDLTFNKDGVYTVIPAVSDPIDIVNDLTSPTDMGDDGLGILGIILLILGVIVVLVVLMPVLPYIAKGIVWLVCLPFKAIAKLCKGIGKAAKEQKVKRANKQVEKSFEKWRKQSKKNTAKTARNSQKVEVEKLKNDIWSGKKSELNLKDAERYALNHDEEWLREQEVLRQTMYGVDDDDLDR